jgi:hypothetical protein
LEDIMSNNYGTVNFNGTAYTLTQDAYPENYGTDGAVRYYAAAVDADGNKYLVTWETTEVWDKAQESYKVTGEVNGYIEDENNACDWDNPISVTAQ